MNRVDVKAGLIVDQEMYDAVVEGLTANAPGESLSWDAFTTPRRWLLVPDVDGQGYKAELLVRREPARTVKVNAWMAPDLRAGDVPRPHNHPWPFRSYVLMGGYDETRYQLVNGTVLSEPRTHTQGAYNEMSLEEYHEVTRIHVPGRTVTLMVCGAGRNDAWGYLDVATGAFEPHSLDPAFQAHKEALNPDAL